MSALGGGVLCRKEEYNYYSCVPGVDGNIHPEGLA